MNHLGLSNSQHFHAACRKQLGNIRNDHENCPINKAFDDELMDYFLNWIVEAEPFLVRDEMLLGLSDVHSRWMSHLCWHDRSADNRMLHGWTQAQAASDGTDIFMYLIYGLYLASDPEILGRLLTHGTSTQTDPLLQSLFKSR